jgi:hypothetical protein
MAPNGGAGSADSKKTQNIGQTESEFSSKSILKRQRPPDTSE